MAGNKQYITTFDYIRIGKYLTASGGLPSSSYKAPLKKKIKKARLVEPREMNPGVITMNSKFKLKNLGTGKKEIYTLVFPEDADLNKNKISILDTNGIKLFASRKGDVIQWQHHMESYYLVEEIIYQPEAAGDYHL